jgi:hypothetical protein
MEVTESALTELALSLPISLSGLTLQFAPNKQTTATNKANLKPFNTFSSYKNIIYSVMDK